MTKKETMSDDLDPSDNVESMVRFSVMLNRELDRIGYPSAPRRSGKLAEDLKIVRTTSYTILKGISLPKIEWMATLREMGLSMDRLMDAYLNRSPKRIDLWIGDKIISAGVRDDVDINAASVVRTVTAEGAYKLKVRALGQPMPEGATPVSTIEFFANKSIAVLDDDADMRVAVSEGLKEEFDVVSFSSSHDLLQYKGGLDMFSAFLVDWRLPNDTVVGEELIRRLRVETDAPIFILTGDITAGQAIANAMSLKNVHHAGKPLDIFILSKRILNTLKTVYP
jgi:CheY-like chemotaxis protein